MKKIIESILMVAGTAIGGGVVILPAVVGIYSYYSALSMLIVVWLINIMIAFVYLEANCYLPTHSSMISMARRLLGVYGEILAWLLSLVFLYTIMSVYTVGIGEIVAGFLEFYGIELPASYLAIIASIMMAIPIYLGMRHIHIINRVIVGTMFAAFFALVYYISPHISSHNLMVTPIHSPLMSLPIVFVAFGFTIVIPSLRSYLNNNIKQLKLAILIGSLIPLILYILWLTVVMGSVPVAGGDGLAAIINDKQPVKLFIQGLINHTGNNHLAILIQIFTLLAIISSYIGISMGLYDFLADGFKIMKTPSGKLKLLALTFLPSLFITLTYDRLFLTALGFAGLISVVLSAIYPVLLTWSGRYVYKLPTVYQASANRLSFSFIMLFSLTLIAIELIKLYS
jgi:tyrosine-specific transport protein